MPEMEAVLCAQPMPAAATTKANKRRPLIRTPGVLKRPESSVRPVLALDHLEQLALALPVTPLPHPFSQYDEKHQQERKAANQNPEIRK
jgi:hypothetical protein